jgi:hypothetical protein
MFFMYYTPKVNNKRLICVILTRDMLIGGIGTQLLWTDFIS